jgi:hypothetical protein
MKLNSENVRSQPDNVLRLKQTMRPRYIFVPVATVMAIIQNIAVRPIRAALGLPGEILLLLSAFK